MIDIKDFKSKIWLVRTFETGKEVIKYYTDYMPGHFACMIDVIVYQVEKDLRIKYEKQLEIAKKYLHDSVSGKTKTQSDARKCLEEMYGVSDEK